MKSILLVLFSTIGIFAHATGSAPKDILPLITSDKAILVDVREPDEIKEGKVKEASVFASSKINTAEWEQWLKTLPKNKEIYLYCRSGRRAERVADALRALGFKAKGAGGFEEWLKAGATAGK